jgi:hypothetical protein
MYKDKKDGWFTEDKEITHRIAGIDNINISFITVQIFIVMLDNRILMADITASITELSF